jgi:hypothetical protein
MRIDTMFKTYDVTLSLEVFPPKVQSSFDSVKLAVEQLAASRRII